MRPEVREALDALLEASAASGEVTIDEIGEALGARAVSADEIDGLIADLESSGRRIVAPEGPRGEDRLRAVLQAARALVAELGRKPRVEEIAARAGLTSEEVRHALSLAKVMQR